MNNNIMIYNNLVKKFNLYIYKNSKKSSKNDLKLLKKYSDFKYNLKLEDKNIIYYQNSKEKKLVHINNQFNLRNKSGDGTDIQKINNLKNWAYEYLHFDGKQLLDRKYDNLSVEKIIEYAKKDGYALNCRYISLIFTQFVLAIGYKARWLMCKSACEDDIECHCITEVYIPSFHKWIIVDAAYGLIYFDENWIPLNVMELRNCIINNKRIRFLSKYRNQILLYWIKNSFQFFVSINNSSSINSKKKKMIHISPYLFVSKNKIDDPNMIVLYKNEFYLW